MSYENVSRETEGEEYEDELVEAEEDSDLTECVWKLGFAESVYDDSILRIINVADDLRTKSFSQFWCQLFTIILVISANFFLQVMIITRVHVINNVGEGNTVDKVFGPPLGESGSCYQREKNIFPDFLPAAGTGPGKITWDCSPMLPMLLSNTSWLDANNDGFWSAADGIAATSDLNERKFAKAGNLTRTFLRFLDEIRNNAFDASRHLDFAQRSSDTKVFTAIPVAWLKAEQPILHMCVNVDRELCGSLEARGILKLHIKGNSETPGDRVDKCREMYGRCDNLFGELYRSYHQYASQSCGEMKSTWDSASRVILNSYDKAQLYKPAERHSVTHETYLVFLGLMLVIWWLSILEELRRVVTWHVVLLFMPCHGNVVSSSNNPDDPSMMIEAISNPTKGVLFLFILIPRFFIAVALAWIGSAFLIGADDYGELILNGVALAFIIDIDEMMFAALMGAHSKESIANTQANHRQTGCMPCLVELLNLPAPPFGMVFVISMVAFQMHRALFGDTGKYAMAVAYSCLCHAAGPDCLAAQLLGGLPHVPPEMLS